MVDIKQWLEMRRNRRILLNAFPFVSGALIFYFMLGFMTSFLAVSIVYGFVFVIIAVVIGLAFAYEYIEVWVDKGRL